MLCTLKTKMATKATATTTPKASARERAVYDELIEFLGEPVFQIPVRSFMDENCLIFGVDTEPLKEHRTVFTQYKQLVDDLLGAFCEDVNIPPEQVVQSIQRLDKIPDLHDLFSGLFEQVLAANDFNIFYTAMARHNILVQEQVIAMLLATTGVIPFSLVCGIPNARHAGRSDAAEPTVDRHEEQVMNVVIQNSKSKESTLANADAKKVLGAKGLEISQQEAKSLEKERINIEKQMKQLVIQADVTSTKSKDSDQDVTVGDPGTKSDKVVTESDKVATESSSYSAFTASLSKLSPEEIRQRQEFLREQRDKLLAMKKEAREKQLKDAERLQSARPVSARTARSAMSQKNVVPSPQPAVNPEDEKKLAMRRAIAEKLRQEVIKQ